MAWESSLSPGLDPLPPSECLHGKLTQAGIWVTQAHAWSPKSLIFYHLDLKGSGDRSKATWERK